jgi:hypothetical protein
LLNAINEWQTTLDRFSGGHIHAIALDWEKAFDGIPHQRLLLKLRNAGIKGVFYAWFTSYLKGIVNPHLPYRKKLAEFTGANRFSVRCAVFE